MVVASGQPAGQRGAEHEGQQHRAGGDRGRDRTAGQPVIEVVTDAEHEQRQPEVGQRDQRVADLGREQRGRGGSAQHRRPQQEPGDDLADHRGLADPARRGAGHPREDDDDRQVDQQEPEVVRAHDATAATGKRSWM